MMKNFIQNAGLVILLVILLGGLFFMTIYANVQETNFNTGLKQAQSTISVRLNSKELQNTQKFVDNQIQECLSVQKRNNLFNSNAKSRGQSAYRTCYTEALSAMKNLNQGANIDLMLKAAG